MAQPWLAYACVLLRNFGENLPFWDYLGGWVVLPSHEMIWPSKPYAVAYLWLYRVVQLKCTPEIEICYMAAWLMSPYFLYDIWQAAYGTLQFLCYIELDPPVCWHLFPAKSLVSPSPRNLIPPFRRPRRPSLIFQVERRCWRRRRRREMEGKFARRKLSPCPLLLHCSTVPIITMITWSS